MKGVTVNLCIRCGKKRVTSRTWKEKVEMAWGATVVEMSEAVCPDAECQRAVEKILEERRVKKENIKKAAEERARERRMKMKARKKLKGQIGAVQVVRNGV